MEEKARREIETLRGKVLTWKRSYAGWASPEGGDGFLAEEFSEDIQTYVYPYVRRLYEMNHLDQREAREFLDYCYAQVEELRARLR